MLDVGGRCTVEVTYEQEQRNGYNIMLTQRKKENCLWEKNS